MILARYRFSHRCILGGIGDADASSSIGDASVDGSIGSGADCLAAPAAATVAALRLRLAAGAFATLSTQLGGVRRS